MKGYIIHLPKSKKSTKSAIDALDSVHANSSIQCKLWEGVDRYNSWKIITDGGFGFDTTSFGGGGGDVAAELGIFLSHYSLWKQCIQLAAPIAIFEDDVKFTKPINLDNFHNMFSDDVLNLGRPNWGLKYKNETECPDVLPTDSKSGIILRDECNNKHNPWVVYDELSVDEQSELCDCDSQWLFGAHAYVITPWGATKLVNQADEEIKPADVFINQSVVNIYDLHPLVVKQIGNGTLIQPSLNNNWDY
jgi:hypothetical protein